MCKVSDALAIRQAAQAALSAACLVHVVTPIAGVLDRVGVIEPASPPDMTALLARIDERSKGERR